MFRWTACLFNNFPKLYFNIGTYQGRTIVLIGKTIIGRHTYSETSCTYIIGRIIGNKIR